MPSRRSAGGSIYAHPSEYRGSYASHAGGILDDSTFEVDEETAAFIAAVNQCTRRKASTDRSFFGDCGSGNSPVSSSRARDGFERSHGTSADSVSDGLQRNLARGSALTDETGLSRPRLGLAKSTAAPGDYVSCRDRGHLAPGKGLTGESVGLSGPRSRFENAQGSPADYVSGRAHGNLASSGALADSGECGGSSSPRSRFENAYGSPADSVAGRAHGNLASSGVLTDSDADTILASSKSLDLRHPIFAFKLRPWIGRHERRARRARRPMRLG